MLMHASLTASAPWGLLPAVSGASLVIYHLVLLAAMWLVVARVLSARGETSLAASHAS
jgi:hypothetical protein